MKVSPPHRTTYVYNLYYRNNKQMLSCLIAININLFWTIPNRFILQIKHKTWDWYYYSTLYNIMTKYINFVFYCANPFHHLIYYKVTETNDKCELWLLLLENSISSSLYHGITTTYKTQLTNKRTSILTINLEYNNILIF